MLKKRRQAAGSLNEGVGQPLEPSY